MLPEEQPISSTAGSLARALLLMVAVVLVANVAAGLYLPKYTPNLGYWLVRQKWEMALEPGPPVDWVLLGDSTCNQGLDPAVIRERTGEEAVNLCTIGSMLTLNDAWLLEAWIRTHGPPKRVVVMHTWDVWSRDDRNLALAQIPLPIGFWEEQSPPLQPQSVTLLHYAIERWAPLYAERTSLARAITDPDRWFVPPGRLERGFLRNDHAVPELVKSDGADHLREAKKKGWSMSSHNAAGLDALQALAEKHGFLLDLAPGPIWAPLLDDAKLTAAFRKMRASLEGRSGPRVHVLGDPIPFPATEMENADHVVGDASRRLTETIVDRALAAD